ncbi:NAD-dependent epimerase [Pajaroellobacter abortibovis]|uniref:NAD-dependent epimerase n=2 Tax=Pajaroellobacter abortibovis TaxID=1882918 RepID=A0A1L6MZQ1_9BACT|nr:NAD-dependent epimerase [Pajaroellobacter abortibovis]
MVITKAPTSQHQPAILVTGVCGRLGKQVVRQLHRHYPVIGIDQRPFHESPKDVLHYSLDIRRKKIKDIFRMHTIGAVIHLGIMHDPRVSAAEHYSWNVIGYQKLLDYVAYFHIPKLIVLSSANVYGPHFDNLQFLKEESPLLAGQNFPEIRDLVEIDMLTQSFFWKLPDIETIIFRPTHILGRVHNAFSNFLRLPIIPTLLGFDPMIQVIHESDVVQAILKALTPGIRGIFNIAGTAPLPLSHIIKILKRPTFSLPYSLATLLMRSLWSLRITNFPAPELDYLRYLCMVDDERARTILKFHPTRSIYETILSVTEDIW